MALHVAERADVTGGLARHAAIEARPAHQRKAPPGWKNSGGFPSSNRRATGGEETGPLLVRPLWQHAEERAPPGEAGRRWSKRSDHSTVRRRGQHP
jgi:hypothetical protein